MQNFHKIAANIISLFYWPYQAGENMTFEIIYSVMKNLEQGAFVNKIEMKDGHIAIEFNEQEDFERFLRILSNENPCSAKEFKEFSESDLIDADALEIKIPHDVLEFVNIEI